MKRYLVAVDELQANFTGSQQRQGVYILPHAVAKVFAFGAPKTGSGCKRAADDKNGRKMVAHKTINSSVAAADPAASRKGTTSHQSDKVSAAAVGNGADASSLKFEEGTDAEDELPKGFQFDWGAYREVWGDTPYEDAVTALFAEYAVLYGRVARWTTVNAPLPMTLSEAASLDSQAAEFVQLYVRPILGDINTPKVHKLLRHILDAIRLHGNLVNGNTSSNEAGHKTDKRFYRRTNRAAATFTAQVARQSQGTQVILARNSKLDTDATYMNTMRRARLCAARGGQLTVLSARSLRGVSRLAVGLLSKRPGLARLSGVLGLHPNTQVSVLGRVVFAAKLDDGTPLRQTVRAYSTFRHRGAWFDAVRYTVPREAPAAVNGIQPMPRIRYGEVRALVRYQEEDVAIVCELAEVEAEKDCPLAERGCQRLRWAVPPAGDGDWALRVVPMSRVLRVAHIAPDFADLTVRRGVKALPARHSSPLIDQRGMRFFDNAFFPWD